MTERSASLTRLDLCACVSVSVSVRAQAQALALQSSGILPTHLLYFTTPASSSSASASSSASSSSAATAAATAATSAATGLDAAAIAAGTALYVRHGALVQDVFASVGVFVDLSLPAGAILQELHRRFELAPPSRAPRRPLRLLILGPKGAGKATQAAMLALKHGLLHISPCALLRAELKRSPELSPQLSPYLTGGGGAGMMVPDDILVPLVVARILSKDAKARGWVLEGFPRTPAQAEALDRAHITPNRVVVLNVSDAEAKARVTTRRVDPDTGDVYSFGSGSGSGSGSGAGLSGALKDRLVQRPHDQLHNLEAINFTIAGFLDELRTKYANVLRDIEGGGRAAPPSAAANTSSNQEDKIRAAKAAVFEQIEDFVLAPLNSKYAHANKPAAAKKA